VSNKALARAVREESVRAGHPVNCDHTAVSRWLDGTRPRERTARCIASALSAKLGRTVTAADLGLPSGESIGEGFGTEYADHVDQAAAVLGRLWQADQEEIRAVVAAPTIAAAWSEASLSWLVRTGADPIAERPAGARVGAGDIERLRATVAAFAEMDDRFGGGHGRRALVQYLRSEVSSLLTGRYGECTGRALFGAVAEATLLAALDVVRLGGTWPCSAVLRAGAPLRARRRRGHAGQTFTSPERACRSVDGL
jgi:hypothetical protein